MRFKLTLILLVFFLNFSPVEADLLSGIGVIGDSYSDEYVFYKPDRSKARNWVELLESKRSINFGQFSDSTRGAPRNQGFEFNFAQDGDTTSDSISDEQASGLASLVSQGQVKLVVIFIGGDDFLNALQSPDPPSDPSTLVQTAVENVSTIISTIEAASPDVKIVLATLPDLSSLPVIQEGVKSHVISKELVAGILQATLQYNDELNNIASQDTRIVIADLVQASKKFLFGKHLVVAGREINRKKPSDKFQHLFLSDGIHVGTVGQAFIANEFIIAINKQLGLNVEQFKPAEIINIARAVKNLP